MVLGGIILKLEEFEGAASEKDGGSGRGGGGGALFFFWHRKSILSCFRPNTLKSGGGVFFL